MKLLTCSATFGTKLTLIALVLRLAVSYEPSAIAFSYQQKADLIAES